MKPKKDLTKGSIPRNLILLALPIVFGMMLHNVQILIDTYFVAQLGSDAIAALSVVFPVFFALFAIANGVSVGVNSFISRMIGEKKLKRAKVISENGAYLAILVSIIVTIVGLFSIQPIIEFLDVTQNVGKLMADYLNVIYIGGIAFFVTSLATGILQGEGDTKTPVKAMTVAIIANIILDPIFIFGLGPIPAMGVFGAALATVLANGMAALILVWYIMSGRSLCTPYFGKINFKFPIMKEIMRVGAPAAAIYVVISLVMLLTNKMLSFFGTDALAGYGIAFRIETFAILPVIALGIASLSMIGQNAGAKKFFRVLETNKLASLIGFVFMEVVGIFFIFAGEFLMGIFTPDPVIINIGVDYFGIVGLTYGFLGLRFIANNSFQGLGKAFHPLVISFLSLLVIIPLSYYFAFVKGWGLIGIWYGIAIAFVSLGIISFLWFRYTVKKVMK